MQVIVTSFHDDPMCYLTVAALKSQGWTDILVVADGGTPLKWENQNVACIRGRFGSPQASRDAGIRAASEHDLLIMESHVVVENANKLLNCHRYHRSAITFPIRVNETAEMYNVYGHEVDWDGDLWYKRAIYHPVAGKPEYPVAQFGHSCMILDREWYLESGGYTSLFKGWGGEEPYLCWKAWMLGRECWQTPLAWHSHWLTAGAHADHTDLERNLKIVKFLVTGKAEQLIPSAAMQAERQLIKTGPFDGDIQRLREHMNKIGVLN